MYLNFGSRFYSYKYAQVSSMSFFILSLMLTNYSFIGRTLLVLQSGFSFYIWTSPENKQMIYLDRTLALINCLVLYNDHCKICNNDEMFATLGKTISFKIIDGFHGAPRNKVTLWYIYWHLNLFLNIFYLAKRCQTLPFYVYILEIATIQLLK